MAHMVPHFHPGCHTLSGRQPAVKKEAKHRHRNSCSCDHLCHMCHVFRDTGGTGANAPKLVTNTPGLSFSSGMWRWPSEAVTDWLQDTVSPTPPQPRSLPDLDRQDPAVPAARWHCPESLRPSWSQQVLVQCQPAPLVDCAGASDERIVPLPLLTWRPKGRRTPAEEHFLLVVRILHRCLVSMRPFAQPQVGWHSWNQSHQDCDSPQDCHQAALSARHELFLLLLQSLHVQNIDLVCDRLSPQLLATQVTMRHPGTSLHLALHKMTSMNLATSLVSEQHSVPLPPGRALPRTWNHRNSPTWPRKYRPPCAQSARQLLCSQHFLVFLGTNDLEAGCQRFERLGECGGWMEACLWSGWIQEIRRVLQQSGWHSHRDAHQRSKSRLSFLLKWWHMHLHSSGGVLASQPLHSGKWNHSDCAPGRTFWTGSGWRQPPWGITDLRRLRPDCVHAKVSDLHAGGQLSQKKQNPRLHRGGSEDLSTHHRMSQSLIVWVELPHPQSKGLQRNSDTLKEQKTFSWIPLACSARPAVVRPWVPETHVAGHILVASN